MFRESVPATLTDMTISQGSFEVPDFTARCPSCHPTNSVKEPKAIHDNIQQAVAFKVLRMTACDDLTQSDMQFHNTVI